MRNVVSAPTVAVRVVENVPLRAVVPVAEASSPPTNAGSSRSVTFAPGTGAPVRSVTVTVTPVALPGSRTALTRSTITVSRCGITRTVIAVVPLAESYPGFPTSARIVTSCVCWIVGAVNVVMNRPSDPVTPVAGLTAVPVSTTFAFSTGRLALSITEMITLVERPEATEFVNGTTETLRDPFGITWSPTKDQKLSIPPGSLTQPSNRPRRYANAVS